MPPPPVQLAAALPLGVALQPLRHHQQQLGLFTTRVVDAGAVIFRGQATEIEVDAPPASAAEAAPYATLTMRAAEGALIGVYPIHLRRHTTRLPDTTGGDRERRLLHAGVASFMNHGCDPTTVVEAIEGAEGGAMTYDVRAARDLQAGEELTCDYTLAEYDATEKGMDPCLCGAPEGVCLGAVRGFKIARLGRAADHLFDRFLADHAGDTIIIDRREGPEGGEDGAVFLDLGDWSRPPRLLVARAVAAEAVVYEGRSRLVRPLGGGNGDDGEYPRVVLVVGPHALPLDPLALFSSAYDAEGTREVYGCDALMRHACGARATTRWRWDAHPSTEAAEREMPYRVTASRALVAGEELTVDYRTLSYRGLVERSTDPPPAPAVGALGFCCECCGGRVFR